MAKFPIHVFLLFVMLGAQASPSEKGKRVYIRETPESIQVHTAQKEIMVYQKAKKFPPEASGISEVYAKSGYIHPLYAPNGEIATDEFPEDHPHQSGIWMAWTRTTFQGRTVDFWNIHKQQGWVEHDQTLEIQQHLDGSAEFSVRRVHVDITSGEPIEVLHEIWTLLVLPVKGNKFEFQLTSKLSSANSEPLTIETYHYGGMAIRLNKDWDLINSEPNRPYPAGIFTNQGLDRISGNQTKASWVRASGTINGKYTILTIESDERNFRHPQVVRIHPEMPYFCWAPCNEGAFVIRPGEVFESTYRYTVEG